MRYVILDTETTGFEPELGHKLVEIGAVEMIDRQLTGRHFHHYLNPQRDSDEGALAVHGLTTEFLSDKPLFKTIADDLLEFIDGATVLIHNAAFDTKFINAELAAPPGRCVGFAILPPMPTMLRMLPEPRWAIRLMTGAMMWM